VHRYRLDAAHDVRHAGVCRLFDRREKHAAGHEDDTEVDLTAGIDRLAHRVVDGDALDGLATLAGTRPGHDVGAVLFHVASTQRTLAASDALDNDARGSIDQDAHRSPPLVSDGCPAACVAR
jgi:hypothetical protein